VIIKSHSTVGGVMMGCAVAPEYRVREPDKGIIGTGVWAKKSGKGSV
jgi:hypothetical protein